MRLLRVLCVEDNKEDFNLIKLLLQEIAREIGEACFVEHARNASLAGTLMDGGKFDVYIVDQRLEGHAVGTDFLRQLIDYQPDAPMLIVTHSSDLTVQSPEIRTLGANKLELLNKADLNVESLRACLHRLGIAAFEKSSD